MLTPQALIEVLWFINDYHGTHIVSVTMCMYILICVRISMFTTMNLGRLLQQQLIHTPYSTNSYVRYKRAVLPLCICFPVKEDRHQLDGDLQCILIAQL